jgi:hypothetical protein
MSYLWQGATGISHVLWFLARSSTSDPRLLK